jgi:ribonucleoside-diphosphate reductase alpha chain
MAKNLADTGALNAANGARTTAAKQTNGNGHGKAKGLRFGRFFTPPGSRAYDLVEWDRRTAAITGEKGQVIFEQKDVEVPRSWSQLAINVVAQKYFRGSPGSPERETSVRQIIDRVVDTLLRWGREGHYFATDDDAQNWAEELRYLLVTQHASFNSPVWFNIGVPGRQQQASACFINSVQDSMESILDLVKTEGMLFKFGSGTGTNLSVLRSSKEQLSGGGTASGPVSFMRGYDSFAGSIKSGGTTRRAAKMVILNADHPDVLDFIRCKAEEEKKAWALIEAGYNVGFNVPGGAYDSVQFQNANHSVRAGDDFMRAVIDDKEWKTKAVVDGRTVDTHKARDLWREIAEAAWICGDPGLQFDTTIQEWNVVPNTGRINATNPCFTGDTLVHTSKGLIAFAELVDRVNQGEIFKVYTHDLTNPEKPVDSIELTSPEAFMITGYKEVLKLRFSNGMEVRCTPNHRFFTLNRGYVRADELTAIDQVLTLNQSAPVVDGSYEIRIGTDSALYRQKGDHTSMPVELPKRWTPEFAHFLGWMVGDGFVSEQLEVAGTVYGSAEDQEFVLPAHRSLVIEMNAGFESRISMQANGTQQLRMGRKAFARYLSALGVSTGRAAKKVVPWTMFQAPPDIAAGFLRGLFDADGCVRDGGDKGRYVGLGSRSEELVRGVQRLLTTFGIASRIYKMTARTGAFSYTRKNGDTVTYGSQGYAYDLRITGRYMKRFADAIGFSLKSKAEKLESLMSFQHYNTDSSVRLVERTSDGVELTYNLTEPRNHSYVVNGLVVANCSEFVFVDDTACNLLSLNLMKFQTEQGTFDVERFQRAVDITFTGQEILVSNASYPTPQIAKNSEALRPLGLGYANIGALLMSMGLAYDSDEGRRFAGAITAIMTGQAYAQSARMAQVKGPFSEFAKNREPMLRVMEKHRAAAYQLSTSPESAPVVEAARSTWDDAVKLGRAHGYRNAQSTVLAPTGCLVGNSLVLTDRGLVRLHSLGNPDGEKWQDLDIRVATDEGPKEATKFYVNGAEPIVTVETARGYRIQGTTTHRIKVLDEDGRWTWRRLSDIRTGDKVPMMVGGMVGQPAAVELPPLPDAYWTSDPNTTVPRTMTPQLAEFIGYFMGDGSLHSKGIRLCVTKSDRDVVEHLTELGGSLFGLKAAITQKRGYTEVAFNSVRLTLWWEACGFVKRGPTAEHRGKGYRAHVPDAVLHTNNPAVYSAFVRGLFEADGTVASGYVSFSTTTEQFSRDVQALLLALGFVTTRKVDEPGNGSWGASPRYVLRLLNKSVAGPFGRSVGFLSERKLALVASANHPQAARFDHIPLSREMVDRLAPANDGMRKSLLLEIRRHGAVSRRAATQLLERTGSIELEQLLSFFYDSVETVALGEEQLTYDLSVPQNVTYVANGFVSHNTIGLMMDCDTTGIEPDLALVKYKKLVGGGLLKIVNTTVPAALRKLGYDEIKVKEIVEYIDENDTIEGAPHLQDEHLKVFDCAFKPVKGTRSIAPMGHVRMMAAVQPFISGSMSKTVNLPTDATVEDIQQTYIESWKLGLKCIAIYRDGCKRSQPLSTSLDKEKKKKADASAEVEYRAVRRKLPDERKALTHKFDVAGHEGYVTVGLYEDGTPGELFVTMAKEGSTISGLMDAFATQTSYALQFGVPLKFMVDKFSHMRFEPSGFTKNKEIPIAKSIVDYIFRWMASHFLPVEDQDEAGVIRRAEAPASTAVGAQGALPTDPTPAEPEYKLIAAPKTTNGIASQKIAFVNTDAPACPDCGSITVRSGSCYKCLNCGATTGCS